MCIKAFITRSPIIVKFITFMLQFKWWWSSIPFTRAMASFEINQFVYEIFYFSVKSFHFLRIGPFFLCKMAITRNNKHFRRIKWVFIIFLGWGWRKWIKIIFQFPKTKINKFQYYLNFTQIKQNLTKRLCKKYKKINQIYRT